MDCTFLQSYHWDVALPGNCTLLQYHALGMCHCSIFLRKVGLLFYPEALVRDKADLVKVWYILFVRLLGPPFQLGSPSIFHGLNRYRLQSFRNALRPPDISDLLIISSRALMPSPHNCSDSFLLDGFSDMIRLLGKNISRYHEEDSPWLDDEIGPSCFWIALELGNLFELAGVGVRRADDASRDTLSFWDDAFDGCVQAWKSKVESPDDYFASYLAK